MTIRNRSLIYLGLPVGVALALLLAFFFALPGSSVVAAPDAPDALILDEDFDYGSTPGDLTTISGGTWTAHSGAGNGPIQYIATSLSMAGYGSSGVGGSATFSNGSEDVNTSFTAQSTGTVYAASLVNLSAASGGTYFLHLKDSSFGYVARIFAQDSGGNLRFGFSNSSTPTYATADFSYNTTYLVVAKFNTTTGDSALYVLDTYSSTEPSTPLLTSTGSTLTVSSFAIRQASGGPTGTVDGIRIATSWEDAVGSSSVISDLTITKTGPSTAVAGEDLVYEITVGNTNIDPATDVVLTDTLPFSTSYVSDNSGLMNTNPSDGVYVWDFGSIISGTQVTFNLTVTVDAAVTNGTVLTNTVIVTTTATDDNPANNFDEVQTTIVPDPSCGGSATRIHVIQGNGGASPEDGNVHAIEGVVVGDYQAPGGGINGFFVQEDDANVDADPMTSEGILVYDGYSPAVDVNVGDVVRVVGTVNEYNGMTELSSISSVEICPTVGIASPATPTMPVESVYDWEWYEGMLVNFTQTLYVTEHYYLGRYGEISLSVNDRLSNPTQVITPGLDANNLQDLNDRSQIVLDDAITSQNPDPIIYPTPELSATNTLRGGDSVAELTGVMNYAFGLYLIEPVETITFTHDNPRPTAPDSVGGSLQVASFNVLNYFSTIDTGAAICGPSANLDCRGADSVSEFNRQRDKIINAIVKMDADIVGLMEIENHATDAAVDDLIDGLNTVAGAGMYAKVDTGPIGTDAIKVALIYQPANTTPVGTFAVLDDSFDSNYHEEKNRPALAQTFAAANGEKVTVIVNHLKSKGSDCNDIGDPDTGDGQGNCNLTRTAAANILLDWLATDPTDSGSSNFLIIGDLNSYAMEDPITALEAGGFTNLYRAFSGDDYSYVFDGQWGTLDYSLASATLLPDVTGATAWHINSDEPGVLDYNEEFKSTDQLTSLYAPDEFRASDHDPIIIGLDLKVRIILPLIFNGY